MAEGLQAGALERGRPRLWVWGCLALLPPLAYVVGGWREPGFGAPFMIAFLYGPGSDHSTVGLLLLLFGKVLCPLAAVGLGLALARQRPARRRTAVVLAAAGSLLLILNLATRQPALAAETGTLQPPERDAFQQDVSWSPDGRRIAYSEYAGEGDFDPAGWTVWVADADGSKAQVVARNAYYVSWSPDGERLVFGSQRSGDWELYTARPDGSDLRRLTHNPARDSLPAWSRQGRIAFSSDRDGNTEIYVLGEDGGDPVRLTEDPAGDLNPAWSPDGLRVVFFREKGDGMDQILVVDDQGREAAVTDDDRRNTFPSFLPDGGIAFASKPMDGPQRLVVAGEGGGERRELGPAGIFFARWSPDGERIAFIAGHWPRSAIYLMRAAGTDIRKIVN